MKLRNSRARFTGWLALAALLALLACQPSAVTRPSGTDLLGGQNDATGQPPPATATPAQPPANLETPAETPAPPGARPTATRQPGGETTPVPAPPTGAPPTVAATAAAPTPTLAPTATSAPGPLEVKPNIVFILTDDQTFDDLKAMPRVQSLLAQRGVSFSQFFTGMALCCPSPVSILRGQHAHNTGVEGNYLPYGGFRKAYQSGVESQTIATQLQGAGYRTALIGKYLNGYPAGAGPTYIPPGWDFWSSAARGDAYSEYNYTLNENGQLRPYGEKPEDYGTDVYGAQAARFIRESVKEGQPFFLHLSLLVPHIPATPAPRHAQMFLDTPLPRPRSFNEEDVSDKPEFIRALPPLGQQALSNMTELYPKRLRSLQAADEWVEKIVEELAQAQQLSNTYIVFMSDNGFHMGQHRLPSGKQTAYEEDIRVPFIVRGPGVPEGRQVSYLSGNIDVAATFAEWAGLKPLPFSDGRSLVPLLQANLPPESSWRQAYLLEKGEPAQRGIPGPFKGIRTHRYTYVEYETGERELYDLGQDPHQLQNIAGSADPELAALLAGLLDQLRDCAADACRQAEQTPIP